MSKEILREARYYCDCCGYAVLESTAEHIEQAFEQCGWVHATTHHGDKVDYCPTCRRDSPFEVVQRVRERAEGPIPAVHGDWMGGYAAAMRDIRQALEGDSDE